MTIRFAGARRQGKSPLRALACRSAALTAANDNGHVLGGTRTQDELLAQALRHFARHGMSAAVRAGEHALIAHLDGDTQACTRWIEIGQLLDRRFGERYAPAIAVSRET